MGMDCIAGISCPEGRVNPKGRKWVITWHQGVCEWPNYGWHCFTDVPIVLFAYIAKKTPWKKRGTHFKRGVAYHHAANVYWPYHLITCQEEHEESYHHTFHWPVFKSGETFWWRCGGVTGIYPIALRPKWSASRSPFYHAVCTKPLYATACYKDATGGVGRGTYQGERLSQRFIPCRTYKADKITVKTFNTPGETNFPPSIEMGLWQTDGNGKPLGNPLRIGNIPYTPSPGGPLISHTVSFAPITLQADGNYSFSIAGYPPPYPGQYRYIHWYTTGPQECDTPIYKYFQRDLYGTGYSDWTLWTDTYMGDYAIPELL